MKINLLPKKVWKQTLWKTLNVVSSVSLIVNMTMVGVFIAPGNAAACEGSIVGVKYEDTNGNQQYDSGEALLQNWTITLYQQSGSNWTQKATATTNAQGHYEFGIGQYGYGTFKVTETMQTGWKNSSALSQVVNFDHNGTFTENFGNVKKSGNLTVIKHVVGGNAVASDWTMHIQKNSSDVYSFAGAENPGVAKKLDEGVYKVIETGTPTNYALTYSGACDASGNVTIADGDNKTCTLTNTITTGTLIVKKVVSGSTEPSSSWSMHVKQNGNEVAGSPAAGTPTGTSYTLPTGTYDISETGGPAGYTASFSASCVNGSAQVIANQTTTCTVTNTRDTGTITVIKHVVGGSAHAHDWDMHIKQGDTNIFTFDGAETPGTQRTVVSGTYKVTETNGPSNYTLSYSGDCDTNGNVTVGKNENKTCTLTNTRNTGLVYFDKIVPGYPNSESLFTFHVQGDGNYHDGESASFNTGSYTITENSVTGYSFQSATGICHLDTQNNIVMDVTTNGGTCTITNTRDTGTLVIHKDVKNPDNGPISDNHSFGVTVKDANNQTVYTGTVSENSDVTVSNLPTGTYSVFETADNDYTFVSFSVDNDNNPSNGAQVTVIKGGNKDLAITNKQKKATITINKDVRDYLGNNISDNHTFKLNGNTYTFSENSPRVLSINPGTYTYTEDADSLYTLHSITGDNNGDPADGATVTVASNGSATLTFVNYRNAGHIVVHKNVVRPDGQTDVSDNHNFTVKLDGSNAQVINESAPYTYQGLPTGQYTVSENADSNYSFVKFTDLNGNTIAMPVTVSNGVTTHVVVVNKQHNATITVEKNVVGPDGQTEVNDNHSFGIHVGSNNGTISEDQNATFTVWPDSYHISENGDIDYSLVSILPTNNVTVASGDQTTVTITNKQHYGTVTVCKKVDTNGDGNITEDPNYTAQGGWPMMLDQTAHNTGENGCTTFTEVIPGNHSVSEGMINGWMNTYTDPAASSFTIASGQSRTFTFGNFQKASVTVTKLMDADENSATTGDQTPKQGWTVQLWKDSVQVGGDEVTAADGTFTWNNLEPGNYTVKEIVPAAYKSLSNTEYPFTVQSGKHEEFTFINFQYGKISGYKLDSHEQPLNNWQICLSGGSIDNGADRDFGITSIDAVTNFIEQDNCVFTGPSQLNPDWANGYYEFTWLHAGNYIVSETNQYGWTQVYPDGDGMHHVSIQSGSGYGDNSQQYNFVNRLNEFNVDIEKSAPATINAGEQMTYTLDWTVTGNIPVDTTITDPLPVNTTFVSATNGGFLVGDMIRWNLGIHNPGDSGTVTVTVRVASPLTNNTVITNNAQICGLGALVPPFVLDRVQEPFNSDGPALTHKCDSDDTTTTVHSSVTGTIAKINTPDPVVAGANISYTITWTITGNADSTNTKITDPLPANTTFVSVADSGTYDAATNTITWNLGTQHPGAAGTVHFVAKANTPLPNGTVITNTAYLKSTEIDPAKNASAVTHVTSAPILGITKVIDVTTFVNPGATVNYTVTIKNTGNDTAVNVKLTDLLPAGFTYTDLGGSSHTWTLGNLAAGAQTSVTYKVTVGASVAAGTYNNLAVANADNYPNITATIPVEVRIPSTLGEEALPKLVIEKSVNKTYINPGNSATFTIKITNKGEATAINVQLQDVLPAGFTFENKDITKVWMLGDLKVGDSVKITYKALSDKTIKPGTYENLAVAWADNYGKVNDSVKLEVRAIKVLGAELPKTGASAMDYLYFFIAGLILVFSLYILRLTVSREE
jgi:uncharacterized repeat protein (TIGR01451 family)